MAPLPLARTASSPFALLLLPPSSSNAKPEPSSRLHRTASPPFVASGEFLTTPATSPRASEGPPLFPPPPLFFFAAEQAAGAEAPIFARFRPSPPHRRSATPPTVEAVMVNARIQKTVRAIQANVGYIGPPTDFNYEHEHHGTGPQTLVEIAEGRHPFCSTLQSAENPIIIAGAGLFEQEDQDAVLSTIETVAKKFNVTRADWNDLNVLLLHAAQAALDLSLVANPIESIKPAKFLYLMGADDIALHTLPDNAFVVYQGHHDDKGVYRANVILPSSANNSLD